MTRNRNEAINVDDNKSQRGMTPAHALSCGLGGRLTHKTQECIDVPCLLPRVRSPLKEVKNGSEADNLAWCLGDDPLAVLGKAHRPQPLPRTSLVLVLDIDHLRCDR